MRNEEIKKMPKTEHSGKLCRLTTWRHGKMTGNSTVLNGADEKRRLVIAPKRPLCVEYGEAALAASAGAPTKSRCYNKGGLSLDNPAGEENKTKIAYNNFFLFSLIFSLFFVLSLAACDPIEGDIESLREEAGLVYYTVTFNSNGGSPAPGQQTVKKGGKITEPPAMTRSGYIFGGWNNEAALTNQWNFAVDTVTGNITLYAKWAEIGSQYTVTFHSNGGGMVASQVVYEGEQAVRPVDPILAGQAFGNWYSDNGLTAAYNFSTPVTGNMELYASWVAPGTPKHTVVFISNGGSAVASQSVYQGEKAFRPVDPALAGRAFADWYMDTNRSMLYEFTNPIIGSIYVYADWMPATVTFDKNGGDTEANPHTVTLTPPATTVGTLPAQMTRTGYTHTGWNTQANGTGTAFTSATTVYGHTTVYAQWNPITYTVSYNANNGTGTMAVSVFTYDEPQNLRLNSFTRAGYTFSGWASTAGGTVGFTDGQRITVNFTAAAGATVTLYAQWEPITYIVTFDKNGGDTEAEPRTKTVTYPATTVGTLPVPPTRTGYTHTGWNTQIDGMGTSFTAATTVIGNITVYAQWFPVYTVTFDKNGGDTEADPRTKTVTYPATTVGTLPVPPTRTGYIHTGWNTRANGTGTPFTATTALTGNITVYAQWEEYADISGIEALLANLPDRTDIVIESTTNNVPGLFVDFGVYWVTDTVDAALTAAVTAAHSFAANIAVEGTNAQRDTIQANLQAAIAAYTGATKEGLGLVFIDVPPGSFTMYGGGSAANASTASAVATTTITRGFKMAKYEVTVGQWEAVMGDDDWGGTGDKWYTHNSATLMNSGADRTRFPASRISWYDAIAFCNKLSALTGRVLVYQLGNTTTLGSGGNDTSRRAAWATVKAVDVPAASRNLTGTANMYNQPSTAWNAAREQSGASGTALRWASTGSTSTAFGTAAGFRLPSEHEWRWAAMGADKGNFVITYNSSNVATGTAISTRTVAEWGYRKAFAGQRINDATPAGTVINTSNYARSDYAWASLNDSNAPSDLDGTRPVGTKRPNELGIYDMSGNVAEWCFDQCTATSGRNNQAAATNGGSLGGTDWRGTPSTVDSKIAAGGDWEMGKAYYDSSSRMVVKDRYAVWNRTGIYASLGYNQTGIRLVMTQ